MKDSLKSPQYAMKLFVSGVPKKSSLEEVQGYFASFGEVRIERYGGMKPVSSHPRPTSYGFDGSGYCIVTTSNPQVYESILKHQPHRIHDRKLEVDKYRTGLDLIIYNTKLNNRKIILKNVPAWIGSQEIKNNLQHMFGPVERIYVFKVNAKTSKEVRKLRCYSVEFTSKDQARQAIIKGKLWLEGVQVEVVRFRKRKAGTGGRGAKEKEQLVRIQEQQEEEEQEPRADDGELGRKDHCKHDEKPTSRGYFRLRADVFGDTGSAFRFNIYRPK